MNKKQPSLNYAANKPSSHWIGQGPRRVDARGVRTMLACGWVLLGLALASGGVCLATDDPFRKIAAVLLTLMAWATVSPITLALFWLSASRLSAVRALNSHANRNLRILFAWAVGGLVLSAGGILIGLSIGAWWLRVRL